MLFDSIFQYPKFIPKKLLAIAVFFKILVKFLGFFPSAYTFVRNRYEKRLLPRNTTFEIIRDKNYKKLAQYEQAYKECEDALNELKQLDLPPEVLQQGIEAREKAGYKRQDQFIQIRRPNVSLTEFEPIGIALDPEFIQRQARAQKIFERAMSCRAIKDLYIEAMRSPHRDNRTCSWALLLRTEEEEEGKLVSGAYCRFSSRRIVIDVAQSDDQVVSDFVFELTNAASASRFRHLGDLAEKGQLGREEYAIGTEAIEHEGTLRHHSIMSVAIKEMGWNPSMDYYRSHPLDFEEWLKENEYLDHTNRYRKQWDGITEDAAKLAGQESSNSDNT